MITESALLDTWEERVVTLQLWKNLESILTPIEYSGWLIYLGRRNMVSNPIEWAHDMAKEKEKNVAERDRWPFWLEVRRALREALDNRGQA